ncbi:aquaporin Z [alpha proteobacterium U9-1i]|nr:aquaporin Z [alpha proteobacterium U9-1i]
MTSDDWRAASAEFVGSLFLAGVVIGSGIMGGRLADGNEGVALLANTLATAAALYVLIVALAPISSAHFNPAVTLVAALRREIAARRALLFALAQIAGCIAGAMLAHAMFDLPLVQTASTERAGAAQLLSEGVATFALMSCIILVSRVNALAVPTAVALTIAAGYWWTSSTSFANPAITIARAMSDTFAGVRPQDAPGFIVAQLVGAVLAILVCGRR